ncbi:MAG: hypothetical protein JST96_13670 [Bacteroidetes bacterium]|nr:hypothetical protein [Bacteroidota bacterium]
MLPVLLFWLFRQLRRKQLKHISQKRNVHLTRLLFLIAFLTCSYQYACAQQRVARYNIIHKGECKGSMLLTEENKGKTKHIRIESEVKVSFILSFKIHSVEEAIFENGVLVYSLLYRKINGDEKTNQQMELKGSVYKITSKDNYEEAPAYPVYNTILSLYSFEPVNLHSVYSDNFRKYVALEKKGDGIYKVDLPNGNTNYYTYKEGVCVMVDVQQSFYPLQFVLTN